MRNTNAAIALARRRVKSNTTQAADNTIDAILGDANGQVDAGTGYHWVRRAASADENDNSTVGAAFRAQSNPAGGYYPGSGRRVKLERRGNEWRVKEGSHKDMLAAGINPSAGNPMDPYNKFIYLDQIVDLNAYEVTPLKIAVREWNYRTTDNEFKIWRGTTASTHYDLTPHIPGSANQQCYGLLVFNITEHLASNYPIQVYTSTPITTLGSVLGESDLQECYSALPTDEIIVPIKAYALVNGMSRVRGVAADLHVKQLINIPAPGTMSSFTISADDGTPEDVENGDNVAFVGGDGIGTSVSAPDTITISVLDGGITTDKLADDAVTDAKVNDVAIGKLTGLATKGDLIVRNSTGPVRQAVGLDYQPLIADSSSSTGVSYGPPAIDLTVTWGEAMTIRSAVYLRISDGKWYKTNATLGASPLRMGRVRGLVSDAGTGLANGTGKVRIEGLLGGFSSLTVNRPVSADYSDGALTTFSLSADTDVIAARFGRTVNSSTIYIDTRSPVLYRTSVVAASGGITTVTHHSDTNLDRVVRAREYIYSDGAYDFYDSSNRDTDVSLQGAAPGTITIDSAGATSSILGASGATVRRLAQAITPTATSRLLSFTPRFGATTGAPSGVVNWRLETDNSDKPSGTLVLSSGCSGSFTPTASADNPIAIPAVPVIASGTKVWMVFETSIVQTGSNFWTILSNLSGSYTGGSLKASDRSGGAYDTTWAVGGGTVDMRATCVMGAALNLAQSYTAATSERVTRMRLWMKKTGSPASDLTVKIYSDAAGLPNTLIGSSTSVSAATLSTSYDWVEFVVYVNVTISQAAGTVYHVVLDTTGSADGANFVEWGADSSSPSFTGAMSVRTSGGWSTIIPSTDACFEVYTRLVQYQQSVQEGSFTPASGSYAYAYGDASDGTGTETITRFKNTSATPKYLIYETAVP